jgi:hypothetical protein
MRVAFTILILIVLSTSAESHIFKGTVKNSLTQQPVAFAVIYVKGSFEHVISDTNGYFEIPLFDLMDSLFIYAMGYSKFLLTPGLQKSTPTVIYLSPTSIEITGAEINALQPLTVISRMINIVDSASKEKGSSAFYRQLHQENGKAVRLIEADIDILWNTENGERIIVNQMRRSKNMEKNGLQHGDHLFDLLSLHPIRNKNGTILNRNSFKDYCFYFDDKEDDNNYVINYEEKNRNKKLFCVGQLIIEKESFHLLYFERKRMRNPLFKQELFAGDVESFTWDMWSDLFSTSFIWHYDTILVRKTKQSYYHQLINNVFKSVDYHVTETFTLDIFDNNHKKLSNRKEARSSLYGRPYIWSGDFWSNYQPLLRNPLNPESVKDLTTSGPLESQFKQSSKEIYVR